MASNPPNLPDDWDRRRGEQVRKNESVFREHNRRRLTLERAASSHGEGTPVPLVCECGDANCFDAVLVTIAEFDQADALADRYTVKPHHVMPDFERVVEMHDRYWVVEKFPPQKAGDDAAALLQVTPNA